MQIPPSDPKGARFATILSCQPTQLACNATPAERLLRKSQSSNEMPARAAANLLKLFTWRLLCMVALRSSAKGKSEVRAERAASSEAPTAGSRAPRAFLQNSAPSGTATNQSNVIRIYTSKGKPPVKARWPTARPPTRCSPQPGTTSSTKERNLVAEDSRFFQRKDDQGRVAKHLRSGQWRLGSTEAPGAFDEFQKTRDCRSHVAPHLCG